MLTEATVVHANGHGYPNTPGIYTDAQKEAWKPIVQAVQAKGASFFCQIWYCGRASHCVYNPGASAHGQCGSQRRSTTRLAHACCAALRTVNVVVYSAPTHACCTAPPD
jgi:2,4-dienoyl-CoA reductase-like NADH-dependent reductase (Old Yellow Enzyme family)